MYCPALAQFQSTCTFIGKKWGVVLLRRPSLNHRNVKRVGVLDQTGVTSFVFTYLPDVHGGICP